MNRSIGLVALFLLGSANYANAQFGTLGQPPTRQRPTVSPYVNMGAGGGINAYYGIIKPQLDTNRAISQLQTGVQLLNTDGSLKGALTQAQSANTATTGSQTGHPATYFNYSHYFPMSYGSPGMTGTSGGFGTGVGGVGGVGGRTFFGSTLNRGFVR